MQNQGEQRTDIEKLNILLLHWHNHGYDHIRDQEKWIKQAEQAGLSEVAEELRKVIHHSQKANRHIAHARMSLKNRIASHPAIPKEYLRLA